MNQTMLKKALPSIMIPAFVGVWFVACALDENGTSAGSTSSSSSSANSTSSGMGGELFTVSSSSSSSGMGGMGGAGGGSSSSSGGKGDPCAMPTDCGTTLTCDDGVCCEKTCDPCFSCNQANSKGTCTAVTKGTDDCPTDGQLCSDLAQCECGISLPLSADGTCPADAKWSSPKAGVCVYTCDQMDECKNKPAVTCAAGSDCVIDCSANGSCEGTVFNCPAGYKCTMNCPTTDSCKNSTLNCSADGPCHVECGQVGGNSCNMTVNCGSNDCTSNCDGVGKPTIVPKPGTVCSAKVCQ